ncbi:MAG: cyclase family protein [Candidatus Hydrogenedentes bacterium]|nr:cyclase family protein [Candidatus Hydrogenedentota bacterium]
MSIHWYDVSIPLRPGMTVWPGDPPFQFLPASRMAEGASCNTSVITCSTHTGTHCDAPWHFEHEGKRLDAVDTAVFFGDALLVEVMDVDVIRAEDLGEKPFPPRVLFKTKNSGYPSDAPFKTDFVGLDPSAAQRLVDDGVRLVGIDYLSIAPYKKSAPTHHILLQNEVFVVEGLQLANFSAGIYSFVVLPMPLAGADGAPCRAFIGRP